MAMKVWLNIHIVQEKWVGSCRERTWSMDADGCLMKPCSHTASTRGNFQAYLQISTPTTLWNLFHTIRWCLKLLLNHEGLWKLLCFSSKLVRNMGKSSRATYQPRRFKMVLRNPPSGNQHVCTASAHLYNFQPFSKPPHQDGQGFELGIRVSWRIRSIGGIQVQKTNDLKELWPTVRCGFFCCW